MSPVTVVVDQVFLQRSAQVSFIRHDDSVKTLSTDRSDHTFCIRVLPRRSRSRHDIVDPEGRYSSFNSISIFGVAVSDHILRCRIKRKRLSELLRDPLRGWVCGNIEMDHAPTCVFDDDEDVEHIKSMVAFVNILRTSNSRLDLFERTN